MNDLIDPDSTMDPSDPSKRWRVIAKAAISIAIASLAVTVVTAFVAADANNAAAKAQAAVDQVIEQRTESRKNTCENNRKFAEAHNKLVIGIVTAAGTREIPPSLNEAVKEQIVPVPDCSPEGIREFYEGAKP